MSFEIGLTTWTFGEKTFEEKCKIAHEIGVDGIEIQGDLSYDPLYVKEIADKYGLKIYSITPDNVDIYSDDNDIRNNAIEYYLSLVKWTKAVGSPRFCLHGEVSKIIGSGNLERDWNYLVDSTNKICKKAAENDLEVVFEVLNRYESSMINTIDDALQLIEKVDSQNLKALLDSYHMNIEESDPAEAILTANENLGIYHIADSNREAVGNGNADLEGQLQSLVKINYTGPIIMEMTAKGPNPFTPIKDDESVEIVSDYYKSSIEVIKRWESNI